jgi:hypothetical protein
VLALACLPAVVRAQAPVPATATQHAARMAALESLLAACAAQPTECNPERVGADEQIQLEDGTVTRIRLEWLRAGIENLGKQTGAVRKEMADGLGARLSRLKTAPPVTFSLPAAAASAQGEFNRVLAAKEFAPERQPSWIERKWTEFWRWVGELLSRSFAAASNTPVWVRYFFEALLFLIPVLLLAVWLLRQVREERLRAARGNDPRPASPLAPSAEWLTLAEELARAGEWRQAIHALYWATIADFEVRHIWQRNQTRTPREYLRLLEPGSEARRALAEQTRLFELAWYGYREASREDYLRAQELRAATEARG